MQNLPSNRTSDSGRDCRCRRAVAQSFSSRRLGKMFGIEAVPLPSPARFVIIFIMVLRYLFPTPRTNKWSTCRCRSGKTSSTRLWMRWSKDFAIAKGFFDETGLDYGASSPLGEQLIERLLEDYMIEHIFAVCEKDYPALHKMMIADRWKCRWKRSVVCTIFFWCVRKNVDTLIHTLGCILYREGAAVHHYNVEILVILDFAERHPKLSVGSSCALALRYIKYNGIFLRWIQNAIRSIWMKGTPMVVIGLKPDIMACTRRGCLLYRYGSSNGWDPLQDRVLNSLIIYKPPSVWCQLVWSHVSMYPRDAAAALQRPYIQQNKGSLISRCGSLLWVVWLPSEANRTSRT